MRIFYKGPDGGNNSPVVGYWLIELKGLFSIALLKFNKGSREAYHTHAFNAVTWFLWGNMLEQRMFEDDVVKSKYYKFSLIPKYTPRNNLHRVIAYKTSWALTIRGPWKDTWQEYKNKKYITLTHGRKIID